jgi:hypothetical protein
VLRGSVVQWREAASFSHLHIAKSPFHKLYRKGGMEMEIVFVPGGKDREALAEELVKWILEGENR